MSPYLTSHDTTACPTYFERVPVSDAPLRLPPTPAEWEAMKARCEQAEAEIDRLHEICLDYMHERDDARNLVAEVSCGVTHYSGPGGCGDPNPCVRCQRDQAWEKIDQFKRDYGEPFSDEDRALIGSREFTKKAIAEAKKREARLAALEGVERAARGVQRDLRPDDFMPNSVRVDATTWDRLAEALSKAAEGKA